MLRASAYQKAALAPALLETAGKSERFAYEKLGAEQRERVGIQKVRLVPDPNRNSNPNPNPSPSLNPTLTPTRTRTLTRHGLCDAATGLCACKEGWAGDNCAQRACAKHPHGCLNGGTCRGETCFCPFGFTGEDCGQRLCPRGCSGRGVCGQDGACTCPSYP